MSTSVQVKKGILPNTGQGKVVGMTPEDTKTKCLFADGTSILVSDFLASFIHTGDELHFPLELQAADAGTQIYVRNSSTQERKQDKFQAEIGYATQPRRDKRGNLFVSAEVVGGCLGISAIHLPCQALRNYFYVGNRQRPWDRQLSFYELLRVA